MTFAEWEDYVLRGIEPPVCPERAYDSSLTQSYFKSLMEDYFREVVHPHVVEMQRKYPNLFRGEWDITGRLKARYPSGRLTDEEYNKKWEDAMRAPSLFQKIKKDSSWQGGTFVVPFKGSV